VSLSPVPIPFLLPPLSSYLQLPNIPSRILVFGTDLKSIKIPAQKSQYEIKGTCTSEWTSLLPFPVKMFRYGIYSFPSFFCTFFLLLIRLGPHAHRLGRVIWTEQYREGKLLRSFGTTHYGEFIFPSPPLLTRVDFNYQRSYFWPDYIEFLPGDQFVTHCIYDSTSAVSIKERMEEEGEARKLMGY
jgi:hypothetical protein